MTIVEALAIYGVYRLVMSMVAAYHHLFGDREGNSGRFGHYLEGE